MKKIITLLAFALPFILQSCLKDEVYGGATISNISNTIAYTENTDVTVSATVSSLVSIESVNLVYTAQGSTEKVGMTANGQTYTGIIPAMPLQTEVVYHIEAATATMTAVSSDISYTVGATPIDYSGLVLNELNGNDKFIEILNIGVDVPTISGIYIEKDGKNVWTGDNRGLKKGEFLLLYSEDVVIAGEAKEGYEEALVFHSGLSAKKPVRVQLFSPSSTSLSDFNLLECAGPAPASYSRNNDGKWYHADATPGAANVEGTDAVLGLENSDPVVPKVPGSVMLSELNGNDKFIELANPGDEDFPIAGYTIEKDGKVNWTAAEGTVVPAHGFILLYSEDVVIPGEAQEGYDPALVFASGLSAKKPVMIELKSAGAASVDIFNLVNCAGPAPASYSRNKDGKWYYADATPGKENVEGTEEVTGLE